MQVSNITNQIGTQNSLSNQRNNNQTSFGATGSNLANHYRLQNFVGSVTEQMERTYAKLRDDGCLHFEISLKDKLLTICQFGESNVVNKRLQETGLAHILQVAEGFLDSFTSAREAMFATFDRTALERGRLREALNKLDLDDRNAQEKLTDLFVDS